mgnify:CR=1 FL=1
MAIFDVLHPDTQVLGSYFLEASAGTGKTFAIEHIVPRLLFRGRRPYFFVISHSCRNFYKSCNARTSFADLSKFTQDQIGS